jgi:hypothetical protein
MSKFFSRIGSTKRDYNLTCLITGLEIDVQNESIFTIQYIRGKTVEETPFITIKPG